MDTPVKKGKVIAELPKKNEIPIFSNVFPMKMLTARDSIMKYFRPILHKYKFTEQQWRVLRTLQQGKQGTLKLAKDCSIMPSSVSRLTQGLIKRGLIIRMSSSNLNDLRQVQFMLTEKGEGKINEIAPHIQSAYKEIQKKAGEDNVREMLRLLDIVIDAL